MCYYSLRKPALMTPGAVTEFMVSVVPQTIRNKATTIEPYNPSQKDKDFKAKIVILLCPMFIESLRTRMLTNCLCCCIMMFVDMIPGAFTDLMVKDLKNGHWDCSKLFLGSVECAGSFGHLVKSPGKREFTIFNLLSKYVKEPSAAKIFADILFPLLAKKHQNSAGMAVRISICDALDAIAANDSSLLTLAKILRELNATSEMEMGGFDYDKVLSAYQKVNLQFFYTITEEHALPILAQSIHDMSSEELILRQSAYRLLLSFIEFSAEILNRSPKSDLIWSEVSIQHIVHNFFLKHMGNAMDKESAVKKEGQRGIILKELLELSYCFRLDWVQLQEIAVNFANVCKRGSSLWCCLLFFRVELELLDRSGELLLEAEVEMPNILKLLAGKAVGLCIAMMQSKISSNNSSLTETPEGKGTVSLQKHSHFRKSFRDKQKLLLRLICSILDQYHFSESSLVQKDKKVSACAPPDPYADSLASSLTLRKCLEEHIEEGYELHVLGYTLNFMLSKFLMNPICGKLDYCLEELLSVVENDILGDVSEEKDVEKIASKMKETRKRKSYETLKLIAQSITFKTQALKLLSPVTAHLHKQLTQKMKLKLETMLSSIAADGINDESNELENSCSKTDSELGRDDEQVKAIHVERLLNVDRRFSHLKAFALGVLHNFMKTLKLNREDEQLLSLLDPFVSLLGQCLSSKYESVIIAALRCLPPLVRLPLPSLQSQADNIKNSLLVIAQGSVNAGSQLTESCIKLLTALLRSTRVTLSADQLHMLIQFPMFVDFAKNPSFAALSLLKAIVHRKLVVPEIYDIVQIVAELMQHLDFLLANLSVLLFYWSGYICAFSGVGVGVFCECRCFPVCDDEFNLFARSGAGRMRRRVLIYSSGLSVLMLLNCVVARGNVSVRVILFRISIRLTELEGLGVQLCSAVRLTIGDCRVGVVYDGVDGQVYKMVLRTLVVRCGDWRGDLDLGPVINGGFRCAFTSVRRLQGVWVQVLRWKYSGAVHLGTCKTDWWNGFMIDKLKVRRGGIYLVSVLEFICSILFSLQLLFGKRKDDTLLCLLLMLRLVSASRVTAAYDMLSVLIFCVRDMWRVVFLDISGDWIDNYDLKQLAQEVSESIRDIIGMQNFVQVYSQIRKNLKVKRDKRKQQEKIMAVVNPTRNAKRKLRIAAKHRAHKKRKIMTMKMGRWM
ncbi:Small subunit processome component 20 [Sesamum angolense]|uniref:Small subunit processome component 20 n=1 Tax=Sesamum angolense TaxID=2727404 RepID=A0AAE1W791_9LAMI|nr:Small subunit processome component 20 [Sesamum angolense]